MLGAFKRFAGIFGGKLTQSDQEFVRSYLDDSGQFLFFQMNDVDQRHSVAVARALLSEVGYHRELDGDTLIKAALLHDIGKVEGDLNAINRIVAGLVRRVSPSLRNKLGVPFRNRGWKIRYGFYVDQIHPLRGSHMAKAFGIEAKVVELIRHHHDRPGKNQSPELTCLQLADNKH
jgi:putative nucleotidyltransferase with HDIG domain